MDYKATLNLPKTSFPMKANLPESEPKMLAWWEQFGMYKRLRQVAADRPLWILHDGPPYANGNIHLGHVLNKVLKDVIVKSRAMLGFNAVFVPGWDCHGLPIEHQVDKELGLDDPSVDIRHAMDPVEKRRKCREYALRFIDIQRNEFKRLGVLGDWDNPYVTMAPAYQAIIAREFGRFVGRGLVHKGLKPVHWCMHCKTALAQAEVEYEEQRTPSVWVKFPLTSVPAELQAKLVGRRAFAVVWTTTPWTLPANLAIAVHPTQSYEALALSGEVYLVARARVTEFLSLFQAPKYDVLGSFEGQSLVGHTFRHPWIDREGTIAAADFVGMEQGTGVVHIAPGHGEEDYERGGARGGASSRSATWWRTGPSGSSHGRGSGGCRSSRSTARRVARCSSRSGSSPTSRGSSAKAEVPTSGTCGRPARFFRQARAAPSAAATGSRRRPTSSTSG